MKLSLFSAVLLSSTTFAASVTYKTVLKDIGKVHKDLIALNNSLAACMAGATGVVDAENVQTATTNLETAINQTIADANASPPFGKQGSNKVGRRLINLTTVIYSVLDETVAQKPFFDAPLGAGTGAILNLDSTVYDSLVTQKGQSDQLGAAIAKKFDAALQGSAPFIQSMIDQHFSTAIAAYKPTSSTGGISLPTLRA